MLFYELIAFISLLILILHHWRQYRIELRPQHVQDCVNCVPPRQRQDHTCVRQPGHTCVTAHCPTNHTCVTACQSHTCVTACRPAPGPRVSAEHQLRPLPGLREADDWGNVHGNSPAGRTRPGRASLRVRVREFPARRTNPSRIFTAAPLRHTPRRVRTVPEHIDHLSDSWLTEPSTARPPLSRSTSYENLTTQDARERGQRGRCGPAP